jgi:hypothetical protein
VELERGKDEGVKGCCCANARVTNAMLHERGKGEGVGTTGVRINSHA